VYYSNTAIEKLIQSGDIWIGWNKVESIALDSIQWESCGLDLHLDRVFQKWSPGRGEVLDPSQETFSLNDLNSQSYSVAEEGFLLEPQQFVLAQTLEYIRLSGRVQGQIQGRSLLGRLGLGVHVTAPLIHAGFEGQMTLEIFNLGPYPILLRPRMGSTQPGLRIAQLCFHPVKGVARSLTKLQRFLGQTHPLGAADRNSETHTQERSYEA
jgi:dCTP deaminase